MKIGNGSLLEFILALFFLSVGLNSSTNIYVSVFVVAISLIVIIHSIYLLIKKIKSKNNNNNKTSNQEKNNNTLKPKKVYYVILIISILFNLTFISGIGLLNSYKNKEIESLKNELKKNKNESNVESRIAYEVDEYGNVTEYNKKEHCTYWPVGGVSKIKISSKSLDEAVGGTFSRMNSDKSYLMMSNNPGEIYDVIMKFSGDSNIYECDEDWYLIKTSFGRYGYVWGGRKSMYVQVQ